MKEKNECNHEWSTGKTIYEAPKCDKCGKIYVEYDPEADENRIIRCN